MIKVILYDEAVNTETLFDPILREKRERTQDVREAGFDVKTNPLNEYERLIYWIEFETEEEAVLFKLTYL